MDVRIYYAKVREAMATMPGNFVVLVSRETPDGGRSESMTEAAKAVAARLLVEGRARLATEAETADYYRREAAIRETALAEATRARIQVAVVSDKDLDAWKSGRPAKSTESK